MQAGFSLFVLFVRIQPVGLSFNFSHCFSQSFISCSLKKKKKSMYAVALRRATTSGGGRVLKEVCLGVFSPPSHMIGWGVAMRNFCHVIRDYASVLLAVDWRRCSLHCNGDDAVFI